MTWRATVLTLFPEMFPGPLGVSLAGRALATGLWALEARDIRDSATDRHRSVDDTPAGGGPGMVLRADVLAAAIDAVPDQDGRPRLVMSPRGKPLTQARVAELAAGPGPLIVCGRFEGIDQRVIDARGLEEVSIGDYVLSGGEIAAHGADRRLRPAAARRDGQAGLGAGGEFFGFPPGIPAIHPTAVVRGPSDPGNPAVRGPCQSRSLAPRRGRNADKSPPARPFCGPAGTEIAKNRQKTRRTGDNGSPMPYSSGQIRELAG